MVQEGGGGQQGGRGSISSGAPLGLDTLEGCRKRLGELATEMISLRQVVASQQSTISQLQVGHLIPSFMSCWIVQPYVISVHSCSISPESPKGDVQGFIRWL